MAGALRPGGVLCNMAERIWLHTHLIDVLISVCIDTFKGPVRYAWPTVPTYPRILLCSKEGSPVDFLNPVNPPEKVEGAIIHKRDLRLYNSQIHSASFASPTFLKREVKSL